MGKKKYAMGGKDSIKDTASGGGKELHPQQADRKRDNGSCKTLIIRRGLLGHQGGRAGEAGLPVATLKSISFSGKGEGEKGGSLDKGVLNSEAVDSR